MNTSRMQVILGLSSLKAYVAAPKAFQVLGIVRFGQEFGLLATDSRGLYFRVNGSQVAPLDAGKVDRAIDHAYGDPRRALRDRLGSRPQPTPVAVQVRKHRHAAVPLAH
ncbi:MAG: hypothetical protein HXX19_01335 [Rhodoferax sp.]|nr:hypothetical protein [Rhodoferax sp.]